MLVDFISLCHWICTATIAQRFLLQVLGLVGIVATKLPAQGIDARVMATILPLERSQIADTTRGNQFRIGVIVIAGKISHVSLSLPAHTLYDGNRHEFA